MTGLRSLCLTTLPIAIIAFAAPADAAQVSIGGTTAGYTCEHDPLTGKRECRCKGGRNGHDCKAMKDQCVADMIAGCWSRDGRPDFCQCEWKASRPQPGTVRPSTTILETPVLRQLSQ